MHEPNREQERPFQQVLRLKQLDIPVPSADTIAALAHEIDFQMQVVADARDASGGYGWGYYVDQARSFDLVISQKLGDSVLSHLCLEAAMKGEVRADTLPELQLLSQKLTALANSVEWFEDSSAGYGIGDVRDKAIPETRYVYNGAEQWLALEVERQEIRGGLKTTGFRFFVPQVLLEKMIRLSSAVAALDGSEYPSVPGEVFRSLQQAPIDELRGVQSVHQEAVQHAAHAAQEIRRELRLSGPILSKIEKLVEPVASEFREMCRKGVLAWNNVHESQIDSLTTSLRYLGITLRTPQAVNPIVARQEFNMAEWFASTVNGFRNHVNEAIREHLTLGDPEDSN